MIMVRDFNYFPDRGIYVDEETDHLSAHLFFLRGQKWRSLRQQLTPTFTSGKMRAMFGIVRDCARIMVDVIPSGRDVEVRELIARYSTDVIASCAFAIDVDNGNKTLTTKEMAAQAWVFFLGGFETSSTTVSFCLYELSRRPDIQKKLQEEVDDVMRKTNGDVTYDDIMTKMPYIEEVVNETLRMYPPGAVLNREVVQDYKLPEYDCVLEKGTKVIIPVMGLHYDRKYFRNPEEFDPEHFSVEQKASRHPYSYLPFGQGTRICIALQDFAKDALRFYLDSITNTSRIFGYSSGERIPEMTVVCVAEFSFV
ncbi:probable cytochrome P450 6a14 [Schistocerca piceifrons]|uniref:probable cytochrome P450 6a14 n=1 Tax=Schistocerca piceifrons TaxID=274613 RepID=UPI001F5F9686|nr:probable cytochrome P450 6a14 [Schistocerca piceifrons]